MQDILVAREDATIVRSIIDLARNLDLRVVAEGVETPGHWTELARLGCHTAQGYYLTRPLPAPQLTTWLADYRQRPSPRREAERMALLHELDVD